MAPVRAEGLYLIECLTFDRVEILGKWCKNLWHENEQSM